MKEEVELSFQKVQVQEPGKVETHVKGERGWSTIKQLYSPRKTLFPSNYLIYFSNECDL